MKPFNQPSVMSAQQHFAASPRAEVPRSRFDRSHAHKTTFDAGQLVPIYVDEVLPGDSFHLKETHFARLSTPLRPLMDNLYYESFFFFVPYRLVWDNWQRFCGERTTPSDDPSSLAIPTVTIDMATLQDDFLACYMGLPQSPAAGNLVVSALPFRAYWLCYNEWFRDQNLAQPLQFSTGDTAPEGAFLYGGCATRGKRHDYFTSCLPWPQKGDAVLIPVDGVGLRGGGDGAPTFKTPSDVQLGYIKSTATTGAVVTGSTTGNTANMVWDDPKLVLDLQSATGSTINDLRAAFQIQRLLERDARGGTRYIELILAHFGVTSDDARLQRPEYLGGSRTRVNISPVPATFHNVEVAQGELAGVGTAVARGGWSKSFTEHGIIIGVANVRADLTYQQGVDRFWSRRTRYDFYWPALAHLGEQAVLNKEIFFSAADSIDGAVFGYQERYAEYRYKPSRITGRFNSSNAQSLDVWHLGQDFGSLPALNNVFIEDDPPLDRVVAVADEPHFLVDIWFALQCERPMPVYSVPGMADHF